MVDRRSVANYRAGNAELVCTVLKGAIERRPSSVLEPNSRMQNATLEFDTTRFVPAEPWPDAGNQSCR